MDTWIALAGVVPPVILATVAVTVYLYNRRRDKKQARLKLFEVIDKNFDVLQRLNETALISGENAVAAVQSVNRDEKISEEDARIAFFHYLRLNRMFRLYEYKEHGFLEEEEFYRVFNCYKGTLVDAVSQLDRLAPRGYPPDFVDFLTNNVKEQDRAPYLH